MVEEKSNRNLVFKQRKLIKKDCWSSKCFCVSKLTVDLQLLMIHGDKEIADGVNWIHRKCLENYHKVSYIVDINVNFETISSVLYNRVQQKELG